MFNHRSFVGLDIGTIKTKLVHLKNVHGKFELLDFVSIDTPFETVVNGSIVKPEILGEAIGDLVKDIKLKGKTTVSSVAGPQVYIRNLTMPKMKLKEMYTAVYYQATTFLPIPVEESVIDIFPLREVNSNDGIKTEIFFAAVRKKQVENLEYCCKIAGLNLKIVDLEPLALNRAINNTNQTEIKAILNIGATRSGFSVLEKGELLFYRPLALGFMGQDYKSDEQSREYFKREVLTEVMRSIEYFNMHIKGYPEILITCGYDPILEEVNQVLTKNIDISVQKWTLNPRIITDQLDEKSIKLLKCEFPVALGLAIRGGA